MMCKAVFLCPVKQSYTRLSESALFHSKIVQLHCTSHFRRSVNLCLPVHAPFVLSLFSIGHWNTTGFEMKLELAATFSLSLTSLAAAGQDSSHSPSIDPASILLTDKQDSSPGT